MRITLAVALVAPLLLFGTLDSYGADPAIAGCLPDPSSDAPVTLILLDGVVVDSAAFAAVNPADIAYTQLICSKRVRELFGVEVSSGVVSAWRHPAPDHLMKLELAELASHQAAHVASAGEFASRVEDLEDFHPNPRISFSIATSGETWGAVATHDQFNGRCEASSTEEALACFDGHVHGS